jgi:hypothetical protein
LGLGIQLDVESVTPASLTENCARALQDPPGRGDVQAGPRLPGFELLADDVAAPA